MKDKQVNYNQLIKIDSVFKVVTVSGWESKSCIATLQTATPIGLIAYDEAGNKCVIPYNAIDHVVFFG